MKNPKPPSLIVICGWAAAGKSTVARIISQKLGFHWIDINDVRRLCTGIPHPHPDESEELMDRDRGEMKAAYELMCRMADINLDMGRSVVITATFSRDIYWPLLLEVVERHPGIEVKVIRCAPKNDSREEIEKRLNSDLEGRQQDSARSYKRYIEIKDRAQNLKPPLPYLEIDTSAPHTPQESVEETMQYIVS